MTDEIHLGEELSGWTPPPPPPRAPLDGRYASVEPIALRPHVSSLFEAFSASDRIWDYMPYGPFAEKRELREWIRKDCKKKDPLFFAIVDKADGRAKGMASYLRISPGAGSIEVGHINFSPALQRTRVGTEAMYLMMRNAFSLGYRRYEWKCNALNAASRRLAMRLGLSYEGVFRQATVVKGRNRDTAWYAAIDKEWPTIEAAFETWLSPDNFDEEGRQRQSLSTLTRPVLVNTG